MKGALIYMQAHTHPQTHTNKNTHAHARIRESAHTCVDVISYLHTLLGVDMTAYVRQDFAGAM